MCIALCVEWNVYLHCDCISNLFLFNFLFVLCIQFAQKHFLGKFYIPFLFRQNCVFRRVRFTLLMTLHYHLQYEWVNIFFVFFFLQKKMSKSGRSICINIIKSLDSRHSNKQQQQHSEYQIFKFANKTVECIYLNAHFFDIFFISIIRNSFFGIKPLAL